MREPSSNKYKYKAIATDGKMISGSIVAPTRLVAVDNLYTKGLQPIEVSEDTKTEPFFGRYFLRKKRAKRSLADTDLLLLMETLMSLVTAEIMIDKALFIAAKYSEKSSVKQITTQLLDDVRAGDTLCNAFRNLGYNMPVYIISMLEMGELSGALPESLERIVNTLKNNIDTRDRIYSALTYPAILVGMMVVTMIILIAFVLPRFEILFSESEAALPVSTVIVLAVGNFMHTWWWLLIAGIVFVGYSSIFWLRTAAGKMILDKWLIKNKFLLNIPLTIATARLFRMVGILLQGGQSISAAIKVAITCIHNTYVQDALKRVALDVQAGTPFSMALEKAVMFPAQAIQLARVGEESGHFEKLLISTAQALDDDCQKKISKALSLAIPLSTVILGLLIAFLIGSVLIGLLSINDMVI